MSLSLLLTSACHHKEKKVVGDSIAKVADTETVADSVLPPMGDTGSVQPSGGTVVMMQQDSAEITNLRVLTRKQKVIYSPSLLVGEWVRGTEHEVYQADGTGLMWDSSEDVSRDEAQRFKWTLDSNLLTIVCRLELGGVVPKRYVVTFADDESLAYNDLFGTAYLWDKVIKR